ncbi:LuxR C-terminal-related transcriptional regulator [Nocardioides panacihumi]
MSAITDAVPSTSRRGRLDTPFFRAKLRPPSPPRHLVPRPRLAALLDELTEYPIAAIVAPAGSGKTVLAADWVSRSGRPCAWLALDAAERSVTELRSSLVTALDVLAPGRTDGSRHLRPGDDVSATLARLSASNGHTSPMTLVVDNVDRVGDDDAARAVLTSLVEGRPPGLHLLLLSRRRPPLRVDRLRASGELADISFGTLRFSEEEAALLLTRLCPELRDDELVAAVERANGWAAALQLTALAIRSHRATATPSVPPMSSARPSRRSQYAGGDAPIDDYLGERLIDEYLWEEVLQSERPELVGLLHSAAVVGRINYGLAEALTERPDAGDLLEEADAAGLFLTALQGGWFEVHSLVRDTLLTRLQRRSPDGLRKKHARAAQWFESLGDDVAALDHWLAAERPADALRVLSDLALPLMDAGRSARVVDALAQIPADVASRDPDDATRFAWCHLAAGGPAFLDVLSVAESAAASLAEPSPSGLRTLRATSSWLRADWERAASQARRANEPADLAAGDPVSRFSWRMITCGIALDEGWDDRHPVVGQAWAACLKDPASRWSFEGARAVGLALAGSPLDAKRVADSARDVAGSGRHESLRLTLALADAIIDRELDHRASARTLLEDLATTSTYPDPVLQLVAQLELVRLRMSAGEMEAASAQLDESDRLYARLASASPGAAESDAAPDSPPCGLVARAGVDLALAMDDPTTAARWAAHVTDTFWGPVSTAKIDLARGRSDDAEHAVRRAEPRCVRHRVVSGLLLAQALAPRDRSAAAEAVVGTLDLAARHAMLRTVAAEGAPVMELIELAAWRVPDTWMDRLRHALVPTWTGHDAQRPIEDLTDREREVLRLLPSRLTIGEIASELYVSQNTLKFHLRAIYRKLGVESRSQAVDGARRMRLLPRG